MIADVTPEFKKVMFSLKSNKAPGPDGFSADLFKKSWNIVGEDVVAAVSNIFQQRKLLKAVNSTVITLVPKRPISCCTVFYKCITKILANRFRVFLPYLFSSNQSAFIYGRRIGDNILIAQEVVKGYLRKNMPPSCALKVDLMEAFDSVRWDFLFNFLETINIPAKFIAPIKAVLQLHLSLLWLMEACTDIFSGSKGLRQGDPLSPYLLVFAMEILSCLLNRSVMGGQLSNHPKCKKINLTYLCFAYDLIIFTTGTVDSLEKVADILHQFYCLSRLKRNPLKSEFSVLR